MKTNEILETMKAEALSDAQASGIDFDLEGEAEAQLFRATLELILAISAEMGIHPAALLDNIGEAASMREPYNDDEA